MANTEQVTFFETDYGYIWATMRTLTNKEIEIENIKKSVICILSPSEIKRIFTSPNETQKYYRNIQNNIH